MKVAKSAPEWAIELTELVCKDYKRALPGELRWRHNSYHSSSGYTSYSKSKNGKQIYKYVNRKLKKFNGAVSVNEGFDALDAKLVLLHELAHWVVVRSKGQGHTRKFWDKAFELFEKYGIDKDYALSREKGYKQGAVTAYERRYKEAE